MKKLITLPDLLEPIIQERPFKWLLAVIMLGSFTYCIPYAFWSPFFDANADYELYYKWAIHQSPAYNSHLFQSPFTALPYTPIWALILPPFALFSLMISKQIWFILNFAIYIWFIKMAIDWVKKDNIFPHKTILNLCAPVFLLLNFHPILSNFRVGQANLLAFFCLLLSFIAYLNNQKYFSGFWLAWAIGIKITPAFIVLYWLLKKEYKIAISTIITLIVLWAITIPILGWQLHLNYFEWFRIYPHYVYQQPQIIDNNKSTYAWFYDHFHSLITARILFVATNLTWIGIWGWKIWKYKPASVKESWLEYGWTLALIPLLTHYMEDHHLVLCALLMIMIIRYADTPLPGWYWPLMAMGCFMIDIIAYIYEFSFVPHEYFSLFYFLLYGQIITWLGGTYLIYKISRKKSNNNV